MSRKSRPIGTSTAEPAGSKQRHVGTTSVRVDSELLRQLKIIAAMKNLNIRETMHELMQAEITRFMREQGVKLPGFSRPAR
jgi:hypothetical protein